LSAICAANGEQINYLPALWLRAQQKLIEIDLPQPPRQLTKKLQEPDIYQLLTAYLILLKFFGFCNNTDNFLVSFIF